MRFPFLWLVGVTLVWGQECDVIFVSPNGNTGPNVGTRDNPAELNYAITNLLTPTIRRIYLAAGIYTLNQPLPLHNGLQIEGGFLPAQGWIKTNLFPTILFRAAVNPQSNPSRLVAIQGINVSGFRIQDLEVYVEDATALGAGTTTYALYLNGCSNYIVNRCRFSAGAGANGNPGANGAAGRNGAPGQIGERGDEDGGCCRLGGAGGNSWSGGLVAGGNGGTGGARGTCGPFGSAFPGAPGQQGNPTTAQPYAQAGGSGGTGGTGNASVISVNCDNFPAQNGGDGQPGQNGANGAAGGAGTPTHVAGFFRPGDGQPGQDGQHGSGGGGGGGGGSQGNLICFPSNNNGAGAGGGGGGEGGEGGKGGQGGGGGGGSFGIYLWDNGAGALFVDVIAESSIPGAGAPGGFGGVGGVGGPGGCGGARGCAGQPTACDIGYGGHGGAGGNGGNGGNGGPGVSGLAQDFYTSSSSVAPTTATFRSPDEPKIFVQYTGCTEREVKVWTDAAGFLVWFFGPGSTPPTAVGDTVTTRYSTLGRKNLSLITNGQTYVYYDFLDIRDDGSGTNPSFVQSADTVCIGASVSFTSSLAGAANYAWDFGGAAPPASGPSLQNVQITANNPGTFTITHRTYSPCCGWSDPFRRTLVVLPTPSPTISIQTSGGSTATCAGEPTTFIAQLQNFAPSPTISWLVNGTPQGNGQTFVLSNPQPGVQVQAVAIGNTPCSRGQPISSNTITLTVHPLPQVQYAGTSCISISGSPIPGELLTLSASASGGTPPYAFYWDLGDGRGAVGNPATIMYPSAGAYQIRLTVVDANGCRSIATPCETTLVVAQQPVADFVATPLQGCPPLTVSFSNVSTFANAYRWDFGDGTPLSTQNNPTHVYVSPGEYTVTLYAVSANGNDTAIRQAQVVVYPIPVADFSVFPPILHEADTAFFVSQSQGANSWFWLFGDPANPSASSTQPNPSYYYSQPGRYTVTLIVENLYGCRDTITKADAVIKLPNPAPTALASFPKEAIRFFPNPFSEKLHLFIPTEAAVALYDSRGALIREGTLEKGWHLLELRELSMGIYFLRVGPHVIRLHKIG
ncbi:MAG: PKD domain-containing protein [Bacteroidia bacterium]